MTYPQADKAGLGRSANLLGTGRLSSQIIGFVDVSSLHPDVVEAFGPAAGACYP
ncbi:MAG: hypothetical protein ABR552_06555 [Actinomycetota bacterium]|nr:hypothetical protein [Actinomycetota bacterium]